MPKRVVKNRKPFLISCLSVPFYVITTIQFFYGCNSTNLGFTFFTYTESSYHRAIWTKPPPIWHTDFSPTYRCYVRTVSYISLLKCSLISLIPKSQKSYQHYHAHHQQALKSADERWRNVYRATAFITPDTDTGENEMPQPWQHCPLLCDGFFLCHRPADNEYFVLLYFINISLL